MLVKFCAKVVASKLVSRVGTLKTPFLAEMSTGTVMLTHCLANTGPAMKDAARNSDEYMTGAVKVPADENIQERRLRLSNDYQLVEGKEEGRKKKEEVR